MLQNSNAKSCDTSVVAGGGRTIKGDGVDMAAGGMQISVARAIDTVTIGSDA